MSDDNVMISYSARELLERIEGRVVDLDTKVDTKFEGLHNRVTVLEGDKVAKIKRRGMARDVVIMIGTVVMATGSAVGIVAAVHGL